VAVLKAVLAAVVMAQGGVLLAHSKSSTSSYSGITVDTVTTNMRIAAVRSTVVIAVLECQASVCGMLYTKVQGLVLMRLCFLLMNALDVLCI
jgi:hypothetical protein